MTPFSPRALDRALAAGDLSPLLVTFGLSIVIQSALQQGFGANNLSLFLGPLSYQSWKITNTLYLGRLEVIVFVVAVALISGLQLFLARTQPGRLLRATADNPRAAALSGVNPRRVRALATAAPMEPAAMM